MKKISVLVVLLCLATHSSLGNVIDMFLGNREDLSSYNEVVKPFSAVMDLVEKAKADGKDPSPAWNYHRRTGRTQPGMRWEEGKIPAWFYNDPFDDEGYVAITVDKHFARITKMEYVRQFTVKFKDGSTSFAGKSFEEKQEFIRMAVIPKYRVEWLPLTDAELTKMLAGYKDSLHRPAWWSESFVAAMRQPIVKDMGLD